MSAPRPPYEQPPPPPPPPPSPPPDPHPADAGPIVLHGIDRVALHTNASSEPSEQRDPKKPPLTWIPAGEAINRAGAHLAAWGYKKLSRPRTKSEPRRSDLGQPMPLAKHAQSRPDLPTPSP